METPKAAAIPCKRAFAQASIRETGVSKTGKAKTSEAKTRFSCITEAHQSTRQRIESVTIHEEHMAGKGQNSVLHYNLVHKFILMPQALKIPDAKAAVDKECEKLETLPAWKLEKVKSKKEVIKEAQKNNNKVHFASLMDLCHLKNSELEPHFQKYKGMVVLRGDIVKDDSGAYAVFTEQASSASQMTAIEMDLIARLPDCDGQAADAISNCTPRLEMEDARKQLKIPKPESPDVWRRLPKHKWPKSWICIEDLAVPLERNLYEHPLARLLWERQFEKHIDGNWLGESTKLGMLLRS